MNVAEGLASEVDTRRGAGAPPLFRQIRDALHRRITDGTYPPGADLPSEKELADALGVSSFTCKRAFDNLDAEGLIERGRGRRTRVAARPHEVRFGDTMDGLVDTVLVNAWNIEVDLIEAAFKPATTEVAEALQIETGATAHCAAMTGRRRGELLGYTESWVPEDIGKQYADEDLASSPRFVLMLRRGNIRLDRAEQTLTACPMPDHIAKILDVEPGSPAFRHQRVTYDVDGRAIELFDAHFLWNRYAYHRTLSNRQTK